MNSAMIHSILYYVFPLVGLLLGMVQVAAYAFLLRERGWEPRMMLIGGVVWILGRLVGWIPELTKPSMLGGSLISLTLSAFSILGLTLSSIALLIYALRRRGQANRVAELEAIIATIQRS